ncbi:putative WRKY transcription factor 7 [Glycine soja]
MSLFIARWRRRRREVSLEEVVVGLVTNIYERVRREGDHELMMGYRDNNFMEDNAVCEAASRLESVEKLIKLLSQTQQQFQTTYNSTSNSKSSMENIDTDYKVAADVAISKFKVISLLGHTRTGHTRFKRAPIAPPSTPTEPRVCRATPL